MFKALILTWRRFRIWKIKMPGFDILIAYFEIFSRFEEIKCRNLTF